MASEEQRLVQFAFDDDEAEFVVMDTDEDREYDFKAQTATLLSNIEKALNQGSSLADHQELNEQLFALQAKLNEANATKVKAREERNKDVYETVQTAECVDMCFVIDATASMFKIIAMVKDNIRTIVRQVKRTNPTLKLRLALVVYRDLFYDQRYQVFDFVESVKEFEDFVCSIKAPKYAPHKRDMPEDMAIGIQQANSLSWKQPTRLAFIVADQPCHGFEFHRHQDNFPMGTPGIDIKREIRALQGNHSDGGTMSVYFGRIPHRKCGGKAFTDRMIARFQHYGIYVPHKDFVSPQSIVSAVTNGVRSSVFKTVTTLQTTQNAELLRLEGEVPSNGDELGHQLSQKDYEIINRVPVKDEWERIPAVSVVLYKNRPVSLQRIEMPATVGKIRLKQSKNTRTMELQRAPSPFAEGSTRIAYHGLLASGSAAPYPVILKSFKFMGLNVNDRRHYLRQMEVSNLAGYLAKSFNESSARPPHCGLVHILQVSVIEEEDATNEETELRRFCAERPLPSDIHCSAFTHFSTNSGYWDENELSETLLAFCKYTYEVTRGYLIVTDLQGVRRGKDFFLTDPAILSKNPLRFGSTNVGVDFMERCLASTKNYLEINGWTHY